MRLPVALRGVGGEEGCHDELHRAIEAEDKGGGHGGFRAEEGNRQRQAHIADIAIAAGGSLKRCRDEFRAKQKP